MNGGEPGRVMAARAWIFVKGYLEPSKKASQPFQDVEMIQRCEVKKRGWRGGRATRESLFGRVPEQAPKRERDHVN